MGNPNKDALLQIAMGDDTTPIVPLMNDPLAGLIGNGADASQIGMSQATSGASQTTPVAQPDQVAGLLPTMLGQSAPQPVDNQYTDFDPSDVAKSVPQIGSEDDSSLSISPAFKPHQLSTLGHIADIFLSGLLSKHNNERNMREAVQGFTRDPEMVIRRIATFNPKLALDLQERYVDNQRQQMNVDKGMRAQNLLVDKYVRDQAARIANTLSSAKNPQQAWPVLRKRIIDFGKQYGKDFSEELPDQYSDLDISAFVNGGMSVPQAERIKQGDRKLDQGDRRLDQGDTRLDQQGADTDSRIAAREARTSQGQQRLDQSAANHAKPINVMTKYGAAQLSPDRKRMKLERDGKTFYYLNINGTWVPQNKGQ